MLKNVLMPFLNPKSVVFRQLSRGQTETSAADDHRLVVCAEPCPKMEFQTVHTSMIFVGSSFTPLDVISTSEIPGLLKKDILQAKTTALHLYDCDNARRTFFLQKHGLEFWQLNDYVREAIRKMGAMPTDRENRVNLRQSIVSSLIEWGRRMNLKFSSVVPLDTVYRDTNHQTNLTAFGPVHFAHVDFPSTDLSQTLIHFKDAWKSKIELALDSKTLTDEQYASIQVEQIINVWMPLSPYPTKNTLAVMDISTIHKFDEELQPYTAVRKAGSFFTAMALRQREYHKWIVQTDLKQGDAILFHSLKTPHAAVNLNRPAVTEEHRKSVEIRVLFLSIPADIASTM